MDRTIPAVVDRHWLDATARHLTGLREERAEYAEKSEAIMTRCAGDRSKLTDNDRAALKRLDE